MTQTSETSNDRLDRLEAALGRFAELTIQNTVRHDEALLAHDNTIDVLVANIQQLTENLNRLSEQTNNNINNLAEQAAQDRQQAAIDRQEIRQIWEYLRDRNGGSSPPQ